MPTRPEDLPENDPYFAELRAYEQRLCEWLGLSLDEVFTIRETPTGETTPTESPGLRISWNATAAQQPRRGHDEGLGHVTVDDEPRRYFGSVHLDWEELRELRGVVGERPDAPLP